MEVIGLDLLTNPAMSGDALPSLDNFVLPEFNEPRLVPQPETTGGTETWNGVQNLNADTFIPSQTRMSDEHVQRKKYETLRKFDRLAKMGVPMRKRFTMDSSLEEMEMELEFIRKEKDMDRSVQQFSEWFVTGMGGLEWSSKNVGMVQAFGLQLDGLSEAAQMKVGDMEEDFEELYDLYGDKLRMHPLVRIPIRTCMMVYMVHLTNQMVQKSPIPNLDQVLKSNPDIARQLATAAMQSQSNQRGTNVAPPPMAPRGGENPMAGLSNFMSSMIPPPPQRPPQTIKSPVKIAKPNPQPPAAAVQPRVEMKPPTIPADISDLLKSVNSGVSEKKVTLTPGKKGGSTGKNSVSIKL
ncbi:MAG: hypothetical protein EB127_24635 [Alphaproteobacteria bacterium]|nr:hypothetical protein [Alphaproteobacteria bacterium]